MEIKNKPCAIKGIQGKKITIAGLGAIGRGAETAAFLARNGAKLIVTDLKDEKALAKSIAKLKKFKGIEYVFDKHRKQDFSKADIVIQSPGMRRDCKYLKFARDAKVQIETDFTIFFKALKETGLSTTIIGVTGSKGKSTTAALIYQILKDGLKDKVFLGGNLAGSPLSFLGKIKEGSIIILELSSWDLENLGEHKLSPNIAVATNIMRDHLNAYKNIKEYEKAKKNIFKFQDKNGFLILNNKDKKLKKWKKEAKSKVKFYNGARNFNAAIEVAKLLNVSKAGYEKSLKNFKGLPHRQEFVRTIKGVKFYNDTTATMPDAVIMGINNKLKEANSKLVLIAGGVDKNLEYKELAEKMAKHKRKLEIVLLPGTATDKLTHYLRKLKVNFIEKNTLKKAVITAQELAKKGDIVMLSPGGASFNLFKNELDRGERFIKEVKKLS